MTTTRLDPDACLDCGQTLDAASSFGHEHRPKRGDIAICLGCGHIMIYGRKRRLRALSGAEVVELAGRPDIIAAQKARAKLPPRPT